MNEVDGGEVGLVVADEGAVPTLAAVDDPPPASRCPARVYLASLPSERSRDSMTSSLRTAAAIVAPGVAWESVPWGALRVEHAAALRSRIVALHPTPATSRRLLAALRGVLKASWRLRYISEDERARAADALKAPRGSRMVSGRYIQGSDQQRLFAVAAAQGQTPLGVRNRAMLVLLFVAGLRRSEVAQLTVAGVDRAACSVKLVGKGNKERLVPVGPQTFVHVAAWMDLRGPAPGAVIARLAPRGNVMLPVAPISADGVYKALVKLGKQCGVAVSPHDARRTRITDLLGGGLDVISTSKFVGHDNPATTKIYDMRPDQRLAEDVARIRTSLDDAPAAPPR